MSARVKTLAQIFEQYDKVSGYLTERNRHAAACKVDEIYKREFGIRTLFFSTKQKT